MEKIKAAVEEQRKIKEKLTEILKVEACNTNPSEIDYQASGEVTDMIKDLTEAEKNCWMACYYKSICEAMKEEKEREKLMGYNRNRYANGEYAPSGHGDYTSSMGFHPERMYEYEEEMRRMPYKFMEPPYGYGNGNSGGRGGSSGSGGGSYSGGGNSGGNSGGRSGSGSNGSSNSGSGSGSGSYGYRPMMDNWDPQYGEPYNRYKESMRHYHESGRKEDMEEMDAHAVEHVKSAIKSFREIYKSGSPETKKKLKDDLTKLIGEM